MPRPPFARFALASLLGLAAACGSVPDNPAYGGPRPGVLTGSVSYRQRIALSPQARLTVQLIDVTRGDASGQVVVERQYEHSGQMPLRFELPYDPPGVDARHRYRVLARIEDQGRLAFVNHLAYPVLTQGGPVHVDMILDAAAH